MRGSFLGAASRRKDGPGAAGGNKKGDEKPLWMQAAADRLAEQELDMKQKKLERKKQREEEDLLRGGGGGGGGGVVRLRAAPSGNRRQVPGDDAASEERGPPRSPLCSEGLGDDEYSGAFQDGGGGSSSSSGGSGSGSSITVAKNPERLEIFRESLRAQRTNSSAALSDGGELGPDGGKANKMWVPPIGCVEDDKAAAAAAEIEATDRQASFEARIEATKRRMRASRDRAIAARTAVVDDILASNGAGNKAPSSFLTGGGDEQGDGWGGGGRGESFDAMSVSFFQDIDRLLEDVQDAKVEHRETLQQQETARLSSLAQPLPQPQPLAPPEQQYAPQATKRATEGGSGSGRRPDWIRT